MKKLIVLWVVIIFSLFYCYPAESVNQNVMLINILNEVKILTEKNEQQEEKLDKILSILSKQQEENREQMSAHGKESVKLLKDIKVLLQQLIDQEDD